MNIEIEEIRLRYCLLLVQRHLAIAAVNSKKGLPKNIQSGYQEPDGIPRGISYTQRRFNLAILLIIVCFSSQVNAI